MATSRDRAPWLVLALLTVLLGVLGYLQYRWTHEIGRAAAERRQADLERAARRFAAALDRELAQTAIAFFTDAGPALADRVPRSSIASRTSTRARAAASCAGCCWPRRPITGASCWRRCDRATMPFTRSRGRRSCSA
jgi:hypothetical protein